MSSVFSRKITMSTFSGRFTGDGTPGNQRTGRRQTYRSRIWRRATLRLRMPPPTGVVSGPLMPIRYSWKVSTVSWGSQSPVSSNAFCAGQHLLPLDRPAVLGGGGVEDVLGRGPDVDAGAVALDEGDDRVVGDVERAVLRIVILSAMAPRLRRRGDA